VLVLELGVRVH